jgi:SH3-like domain-containing protein
VLAAAGGIARVRTNQLGGLVVFVRDPVRRLSAYYAHLDSQLVRDGELVAPGDTIGLVGNTGNARTTAPHLHFGIYVRGEGAIDPHPFVHAPRERPAPIAGDTAALGAWGRVSVRTASLRAAPAARARRLASLERHTAARVLGATAGWYRVALPDGAWGYVAAATLERADAPLRTERPRRAIAMLERPAPAALVVDSVGAGTALPVIGEFGEYRYVRRPDGRTGWVGGE